MTEIRKYPASVLTKPADEVTIFDGELVALVEQLRAVLSTGKGVGLAAPQIGVLKRVAIIHSSVSPTQQEIVLVNPRIIRESGSYSFREGCLSLPGVYASLARPSEIEVEYQTLSGEKTTMIARSEGANYFATVVQHEMDHLDGKCFIDRLSPGQLMLLENKLDKLRRAYR